MENFTAKAPVYVKGWTEERKLLMKFVEVYQEVQYIQKRGKNKFHNYTYATEADVNEKVREELSKRKVVMMPNLLEHHMRETTTRNGNTEYIVLVIMDFNFMDAETGETLTIGMRGEGQDVGDKAIYKAISGCQKYALLKAFMIPSGDDPEGDEGADRRNAGADNSNLPTQSANPPAAPPADDKFAKEGQIKMLNAKASAAGYKAADKEKLMKEVSAFMGRTIQTFTEVEKGEVTKLATWLDGKKTA